MTGTNEDSIGTRLLAAYCAPTIAVTFSTTLTLAYIAKYAVDVLLIAPATMGLVFGVSRIWDGVTDPLVGTLSDRTRARIGRRRIWLFASALPIALAGLALWAPPAGLDGTTLTAWFTVSLLTYMTAMTAFNVPHMSLGAELSTDSRTRTRIFGLRHAVSTLGTYLALLLGIELLTTADDPRATAFMLFVGIGVGVVLLVFGSGALLRERADYQGRGGRSPLGVFGDIARNPHGRLLVLMYFVEHMGTGATAILSPFILAYVIGMPTELSTVYFFYTTSILVMVPFWVWLAGRIGKKRAWLGGMSLALVGYSTLFTVGEGELVKMCLVVCFTGAAASCGSAIGPAVQADVVDWDELHTGERKEGAYFSSFTLLHKTSAGLMAMATGIALDQVGFVQNAAQTEEVKFAMRALIGLVPFGCFAVGMLIFSRYSLTEATHARIREQIEARRATGP